MFNPAVLLKMRPEKRFSVIFKVLGSLLLITMVVSMVVYGISVYMESKVLKRGKETRELQENNQDLQISLDRLRSYQKVADASSRIQGLKIATEVIDISEKRHHAIVPRQQRKQPELKDIYGY